MKSLHSRVIKKIIEANGWFLVSVEGDHWQFRHPIIKGKVTLTHPVKDVSINIIKDIERKTGLKF